MRCRHRPLIKTARFLMTGAVELKLHTHVPLDDHYSETELRLHFIARLATRGPNVKTKKLLLHP